MNSPLHAIPDMHALPGPDDIIRTQLKNGIVVLARANYNSPSVTIQGYLEAGSLLDVDEKLGLADFTASALMRGTTKRDFKGIYEALESVGASLGFYGGTHTTGFSGKALVEDLDLILELLGDVLRRPLFPQEHIERLRAMHLTGLAMRAQDTAEMASLTFDQIVFAGHPYSRPEDGFPETISAIQRDDIAHFHQKNFGPRGMTVAVVGAVDPELAVQKVAGILEDWDIIDQPDLPSLPLLSPLNKNTLKKVNIPGKSQTDIMLGAAGPKRKSPDYLAAALGNNILGQFGMYGRIGEIVREKAGLAYYALSSLVGGIGPGSWTVSAGVDPQNVKKVLEIIEEEIGKFASELVTNEELEDSKANFIGRLPLSLESNAGVAGAILNLERFDLGLEYYRHFAEMVNAVTREETLTAAQKYLDINHLGIAVAGP
jgi:zinc protease